MAKTNPIGVRFRKDILDAFKEDKIADTPQKALSFLEQFYIQNRHDKPNFAAIINNSKLFEKAKPLGAKEMEILNKTFSESVSKMPTSLFELKELCPKELEGLERSDWIRNERQKYNI